MKLFFVAALGLIPAFVFAELPTTTTPKPTTTTPKPMSQQTAPKAPGSRSPNNTVPSAIDRQMYKGNSVGSTSSAKPLPLPLPQPPPPPSISSHLPSPDDYTTTKSATMESY